MSQIKNMLSALSKKVREVPITTNDDDADDEADVEEGDVTDEVMARAEAEVDVELGSEEETGSDDDEKNSGDEENEE